MPMSDILLYAAGVLMMVGGIFALGGAIGVLRFPDVFTRMHAGSKAGVAGSGLGLIAVALAAQDGGLSARALLALVFFLMTTPLAAHLVARAALRAGYRPLSKTDDEKNRTATLSTAEQKPESRPKSS
jgi:multicomponent Na+:H+ antiporter subunit G